MMRIPDHIHRIAGMKTVFGAIQVLHASDQADLISDAHQGLKRAIGAVLQGADWQRCRVHFMRNALAHAGKGRRPGGAES